MRRARAVEASEPAVARSRRATVSGAWVGRPEAPLLDAPPIRKLYGGADYCDRLTIAAGVLSGERDWVPENPKFGDPARHTADCVPVKREWRNGRRAGFRCRCPKGRGGSNPPSRTTKDEGPQLTQLGPLRCRMASRKKKKKKREKKKATPSRRLPTSSTLLISSCSARRSTLRPHRHVPIGAGAGLASGSHRQGWTRTLPTLWPVSTGGGRRRCRRGRRLVGTTVISPSATSRAASTSSTRSGAGPATTLPRARIVCPDPRRRAAAPRPASAGAGRT